MVTVVEPVLFGKGLIVKVPVVGFIEKLANPFDAGEIEYTTTWPDSAGRTGPGVTVIV
jgi:hypothetical protein